MKRAYLRLSQLLFLTISLASCGGGGGGGGSGSGSSRSAATGIRVLHGALDAIPVDAVSGAAVLQTARFAEATVYAALPVGAQTVSLTSTTIPTSVIGNAALTVEKNQHYTFLLYGDRMRLGLSTAVLQDFSPELDNTASALRLVHAMIGAKELDLFIDGIQQGGSVGFGAASQYIVLPAGAHTVVLKRHSDGRTVSQLSVTTGARSAYSIFATGEIDYFVATRFLED